MVIDNRNADALAILRDAGATGEAVDLLLALTSCHDGCAKCPTGDAVCCTGDGPPTEERMIVALAELVHRLKWQRDKAADMLVEEHCGPLQCVFEELDRDYAEYMKGRE